MSGDDNAVVYLQAFGSFADVEAEHKKFDETVAANAAAIPAQLPPAQRPAGGAVALHEKALDDALGGAEIVKQRRMLISEIVADGYNPIYAMDPSLSRANAVIAAADPAAAVGKKGGADVAPPHAAALGSGYGPNFFALTFTAWARFGSPLWWWRRSRPLDPAAMNALRS